MNATKIQHIIETVSAWERRIRVSISADEVSALKRAEIKKLARKTKLNGGFRPGSTHTEQFVARHYQKAIGEAVQETLLKKSLEELTDKESLELISRPDCSNYQFAPDGTFNYTAHVEVFPPDIPCPKLADNTLYRIEVAITENDINQELDKLTRKKSPTSEALAQLDNTGQEACVPSDSMPEQADQTAPVTLESPSKEMREHVHQWMNAMVDQIQRQELKRQLSQLLLEKYPMQALPKRFLESHYQQLKSSSAEIADHNLLEKHAKRRAQLAILFRIYSNAHNIQLDKARVQERLAKVAAAFQNNENMFKQLVQNEAFLSAICKETLEEQVIDKLIEEAKVEPKPMTYAEAVNLGNKANEEEAIL